MRDCYYSFSLSNLSSDERSSHSIPLAHLRSVGFHLSTLRPRLFETVISITIHIVLLQYSKASTVAEMRPPPTALLLSRMGNFASSNDFSSTSDSDMWAISSEEEAEDYVSGLETSELRAVQRQ